MRKAIFIGFILLGTAMGLLASLQEEWSTRATLIKRAFFRYPVGDANAG